MQNKVNELKKKLYVFSIEKEKKQTSYIESLQSMQHTKTGEIYEAKYSFEKKQKEYVKVIEQKVHAINSLVFF